MPKPKLLPHEHALVVAGSLKDITHSKATAVWLSTESTVVDQLKAIPVTTVYRHMGDPEVAHLLEHRQLPSTQPYQTIVEGPDGRVYCEGYLRGHRKPSGNVITTSVEFIAPKRLIDQLFLMFRKPEDGCISHGLGDKGGKGLPLFNASLIAGETTFKIILVKRK
eukprot:m.337734 g.337734  ORF g.337734 m.337734 type:complete len:165 (+) comp27796_c0_seq21:797-1291(+)